MSSNILTFKGFKMYMSHMVSYHKHQKRGWVDKSCVITKIIITTQFHVKTEF